MFLIFGEYSGAAMHWLRMLGSESTFVDTPKGIFTDSGVWFRTREALLQEYAGQVFDREPLNRLLTEAVIWLRSAQTLTLWLLPLFLLVMQPLQSAAVALAVFVAWQSLGPSFVSRTLLPVLRVMDLVVLQAIYYVWMMSVAAAQGDYVALAVGLGGFVLLRWGLVRLAARPLVNRLWATLYRMPVADHVLRAIIVRAALKHRIILADFAQIEEDIIKNLKRK